MDGARTVDTLQRLYWYVLRCTPVGMTCTTAAEAEIPKVFGERVRQSLIADANVVNLQRHSPYFYQFGEKINELYVCVLEIAFISTSFLPVLLGKPETN